MKTQCSSNISKTKKDNSVERKRNTSNVIEELEILRSARNQKQGSFSDSICKIVAPNVEKNSA